MSDCQITATNFIATGNDGYQAGTYVQRVRCAFCKAGVEFLMPPGAITKAAPPDIADLTNKWKSFPAPKGDEKDYRPVCAR